METDVGAFGKRRRLASKRSPTRYGAATPLGQKAESHSPRSRESLRKALVEAVSVASERSVKAKRIAHDGEKPLAGDGLSLSDLAKETLEERDARLKPSPKGARCESVESLIK